MENQDLIDSHIKRNTELQSLNFRTQKAMEANIYIDSWLITVKHTIYSQNDPDCNRIKGIFFGLGLEILEFNEEYIIFEKRRHKRRKMF